jgi:hypothetical protein
LPEVATNPVFACVIAQRGYIAVSMVNVREKKRLGRIDVFIIVLISVVWRVDVYKVATAVPLELSGR